MNLERRLFLLIGFVLIVGLIGIEIAEYRHIRADAIKQLQGSAEHVRNVLMSTRRIYHHQFIKSRLPINEQTLGFLPAYAMNRISKDLKNWESEGFSFNNVSDLPRNPAQKADAVEMEAINFFRQRPKQEPRFVPFKDQQGKSYYHYSRPIWIEKYCLKCHGDREAAPQTIKDNYDTAFGYKVGDLRGILSIKIPADKMDESINEQLLSKLLWDITLILIIGLIIVFIVRRQLTQPLLKITAAAKQIGQGELDTYIEVKDGGEMSVLAANLKDMAQQLRLDKEKLLHERGFLKTLIQAIPALVWLKDPEGIYLLCNSRFEHLTGNTEDNIIGKTDYDFFDHERAEFFRKNDQAAINKQKANINIEQITYADDGHKEWIEVTKTPLIDNKGALIGVLGIGHNITAIRHTEKALRLESDRNQDYLDTVQAIMLALDCNGRVSMINKAGCDLLGYEETELLGQSWFEIYIPQPEGMEIVYPLFQQVISGDLESVRHTENHVLRKDGSQRLISWYNANLTNDEGVVIGSLSSGQDITDRRAAEVLLQEREQNYRNIFNASNEAICIFDTEIWRFVDVNKYLLEMYGVSREEALQLNAEKISSGIPPYTGPNFREKIYQAIKGNPQTFEWQAKRKNGELFWTEISLNTSYISGKECVMCVAREITGRKKLEENVLALALQNQRILESAGEGIFGLDSEGLHTFVNPAASNILGYSTEELIGKPSHQTWHHHHKDGSSYPQENCPIYQTLQNGESYIGEEIFIHKDGRFFPVYCSSSPIYEGDVITGVVVSFSDITEKKQAEEKINYLAYYDELTGLPNRTLLLDRLQQLLTVGQKLQHQQALILLNIDRFTQINAARGHAVGDNLLKVLSKRLENHLYQSDTLARLSGDEFAILLPRLSEQASKASHNILSVTKKILNSLEKPLITKGESFNITVSLGVTLFPNKQNEDAEDILRRADTALHQAKKAGGNQCAFFEDSMGELAHQRFIIERELHKAIPEGELRLFLQPQVDMQGKLTGAEALVRWQHPERGLIPPGLFIPIAEESDLIVELGSWVLSEALRLMIQSDMAGNPLKLSVNLSPRQFRQKSFVPWIKDLIEARGADPTHLTLEVTEGLVIDNINEIIAKMNELTAIGIHFSIDDFGTGYSSLSYLKRLPIHELKIDKSFIQDAPTNLEDAALVETILLVAKHMHLKVVAEGVETEEQAAFLNARADVIHQGYLYGKPEQAEIWIARWQEINS